VSSGDRLLVENFAVDLAARRLVQNVGSGFFRKRVNRQAGRRDDLPKRVSVGSDNGCADSHGFHWRQVGPVG